MKILVTGSSGLVGSAAVEYFDAKGHAVFGLDNNMRRMFFGPMGDTGWNLKRLKKATKRFTHRAYDIRDRARVFSLFKKERFDWVVHCASQPSHDKAREIPLVDFEVNAVGTLNLLEAARIHRPDASFAFLSTNKVYGDAPNEYPLKELEKRYEYALPEHHEGIDENCRIDRSLHSLFGASKAAADVVAQEYGRTYGMNVGIFRGGCLTGPCHSSVELHGFMSYLVKVGVKGLPYKVFGYKGKQVRDHLHSADVVSALEAFLEKPRPGEVYNLGGGRANSASILESIDLVEKISGKKISWAYEEKNRLGDHICYISDMRKFRAHYPDWKQRRGLEAIVEEMVRGEAARA
jgi:CDP-paratose 2-epimerase